jgi:DNA-binding response OmpR family regulator
MNLYLENILLLDHQPRTASNCAQVLELLGCSHLMYRDYSQSDGMAWADSDVDIVIAAWTSREIERRALLMALMGCTKLPKVRGVLVVSPFSTPANAKLLQLCGARAWIRYPFSMNEFVSRLRYLVDGERRRTRQPIRYDRRREPAFPIAIPAWKRKQAALSA